MQGKDRDAERWLGVIHGWATTKVNQLHREPEGWLCCGDDFFVWRRWAWWSGRRHSRMCHLSLRSFSTFALKVVSCEDLP